MHNNDNSQGRTVQSPASTVGLVLSGGGAKGAYQAGVLKALNELNIEVGMIAGASIGALNGALISSAQNQQVAAENLKELWIELAKISPIRIGSGAIKFPAYLLLLRSFGLTPMLLETLPNKLNVVLDLIQKKIGRNIPSVLNEYVDLSKHLDTASEGILCNQRITALIDKYLNANGIPSHIPLYASIYPTEGAGADVMNILAGMFGLGDTKSSEFIHVQSLSKEEQKKVLLASAAIPFLFAPQNINGTHYSDGGIGGWQDLQGNTPITPLLQAGCKHIIVTHLSDGSVWDRSKYPDVSIIEIRPKTQMINRKGTVRDVLGFDEEKIPTWIEQGYEDTIATIKPIKKSLQAFGELEQSKRVLHEALSNTGEDELERAMKKLLEG